MSNFNPNIYFYKHVLETHVYALDKIQVFRSYVKHEWICLLKRFYIYETKCLYVINLLVLSEVSYITSGKMYSIIYIF